MALRSRNLLLERAIGVHRRHILGRIRLFHAPSLVSRPVENSRQTFFSPRGERGGEVCAWLEVKTFAYPLPYLEHVGLRRRPARQIASSIFNKALKGAKRLC